MRAVDDAIDELSEYDELEDWGKMYLFDNLIEIMQDLHKNEVQEGHRYDSFMVLVDAKSEIPKPFTTLRLQGALSEEVHEIEIKMITDISRHENGNLTITIIGKRNKVKQTAKVEDTP